MVEVLRAVLDVSNTLGAPSHAILFGLVALTSSRLVRIVITMI